MNYFILNNGTNIPAIGLGTADPMHGVNIPDWLQGKGSKFRSAIYRKILYKLIRWHMSNQFIKSTTAALKLGYRLIDTSSSYNNEKLIRKCIQKSRIPREELFIVTRVSNHQQWNGDIRKALQDSLDNLGVDYVDLYMIHWPVPDVFVKTWQEMEKLNNEGLARSIGVANCHEHHLNTLLSSSSTVPAVNQFEIHPLMNQKKLISFCNSKNISVIAYTPLGRFHEKIKNNKTLNELTQKYNKNIPQIVLRWHYQNGIISVPRSMNIANLENNIDIFDFVLTNNEIESIDSINENLRLRFDPDNCDFSKL